MARGQQALVEVLIFPQPASNSLKLLETLLFGADTSTKVTLSVAYVLLYGRKIGQLIPAPAGSLSLRPNFVGLGSGRHSHRGAGPVLRMQDPAQRDDPLVALESWGPGPMVNVGIEWARHFCHSTYIYIY